ncbi:MAG: protein arginine kinase [Verrucomicrobia bacterium]|nr:protein arginine kinase [Verrucomicrobiota bacterium]
MSLLIAPIIEAKAELTDGGTPPEAIALSTRIRLARNLAGFDFPGWAKPSHRAQVLSSVLDKLAQLKGVKLPLLLRMENLSALEKQILVERHLISRELCESSDSGGVAISNDQSIAIMVNEEDHLRIQVVRSGLDFTAVWQVIDQLDSALEEVLDYVFSSDLGYLTACPTNLGTGMRASAMLHLPGLVIQDDMEKVIRMVSQLGMAVRGLYGEGSEASGSIFQISNQQTLGESEGDILNRLDDVIRSIIEQERYARLRALEQSPAKLHDKIGRAFGILQNGHLLSSEEAMNHLSLMRLAVDLGLLPVECRAAVDRLFIESQPGHVQFLVKEQVTADKRDEHRASRLRQSIKVFPAPDFDKSPDSTHSSQ